jgi:hypothetical protein
VYKWIAVALPIKPDFWFCWLVHEAWHDIRAQGLGSWFSQFIVKIIVAPRCPYIGFLSHTSKSPVPRCPRIGVCHTWVPFQVQDLLSLPLSLYMCWLVFSITPGWGAEVCKWIALALSSNWTFGCVS